ncbi:MAG: leucyl aminopeptidase [Flavobacteriia bacterium]|nr:leucyl aminopeptidase [Flavobacteriia bacterium]
MKLKRIASIKLKSALLILSTENTSAKEVENTFDSSINEWLKSKDDFLFLKLNTGMIFFIKEGLTNEKYRVLGHKIRTLIERTEKNVFVHGNNSETIFSLVEGFCLSSYQFLKYKKEKKNLQYSLDTIHLSDVLTEEKVTFLNHTLNAVYWTRDMVNEPVSYLNATNFSNEIVSLFSKIKDTKVNVLEKSKIEALKMGGLLSVNKGSQDPPTFTIIEYKPKKVKNKKPIVLVGKGVTYDTGGLSLKPTAGSMDSMKCDMAGAAMMVGAIYLCAKLLLPVHLICLIPATDNRPGENAYTPGDIIHIMDGTSVEVLNTDAEGRLILADALAYSKKYTPDLVINAATLTGAAVMAIGTKAACMMSNAENKTNQMLVEAGNKVHERVVELPFWDEYLEDMKSSIADFKNIGGKYAGMISAGKFLEHFAPKPFVHIDIAGPSFLESEENYKGKGGTGFGVRIITEFIHNYLA